jgi:hypothetical protein
MKINQLLKINLLFLFIFLQEKTFAQMGINTTGTPPATNAMLDISSTTKGLLIPRMTTAQRTALAHTQGLTVFDISTNSYWYSDGATWINLATTLANPWLVSGNNISNTNLGNIGIGTNTPKAFLNIPAGKTVLFGSDTTAFGNKFIWYANKGAFRVGYANIAEFDYGNVGVQSFATGNGNTASGLFSVAMGSHNISSGTASMAMGTFGTATGSYSFSMGLSSDASGSNSVAIGNSTTASANLSLAMGDHSTASGINSTAIGYYNTANGNTSIALGNQSHASGNNSTAMGRFSDTNNHTNSFCIGGASNNFAAINTADNQMLMRFDNYTFWVTPLNYAYLTSASNGWAYTSDRNKKENFEELNGESVLKKIAKIPFYSWNFKAKESKEYRHYGIMAQDFHDNFGKDNLGVIGNDTTVSALDLLGVAYSGIKALEKRTEALQNQNEILVSEIAELKAIIQPKRKKYAIKKIHPAKKEELFTLK